MTDFLIKHFIKSRDMSNNDVRTKYGTLSGCVGIFCNLLLCIFKFIIGTLTNSVSVVADAANNLSDASANMVTIVGSKLANKPVDKDHPFGHGRIEYLSALAVSMLILLMGVELGKSGIKKIIEPQDVKFSVVSLIVLLVAIAVKLWMAYFNNKLYKLTGNINMKAVKQDSLNDCIATGATVAALLISSLTKFKHADGIIGVVVSIIIIIAGIKIIKDIIGPLLGQAPSSELVKNIEEIMLDEELIVGVHDLIVHDYGPGRIIASAHAEVPSDVDINIIHDVIDNAEKKISDKLKIVICIHMDPIAVNDEHINTYKTLMKDIIESYDASYTFHDFRVVTGSSHTNLIFDLVVPPNQKKSNHDILADIQKLTSQRDSSLCIVATIEHSYI